MVDSIPLYSCRKLLELPKGIGNLKRLTVLNIEGCNKLRCMPSGIGQLTSLRQLGLFFVGCGRDDARISELENLDKLSGELEIRNLKYLKDPCDAKKACLKQKNGIKTLVLDWSLDEEEKELASDVEQEQGVLSALEPPSHIESLKIKGYQGLCLPRWLMEQNGSSYSEGTTLKQTGPCQYPSITDCPQLSAVKPYFPPSLEKLSLHRSDLQLLSPSNFSRLLPSPANESSSSSSLHSAVPHLRELQLDGIVGSSSDWELLRHHTKLETISIEFCDDLTQVPESIRSLTSLQVLHIFRCPALGALPEWLGELCSLRDLEIRCDNLKMLPDAIQHLTSLESLALMCCRALAELPEGIGQLSALRRLHIDGLRIRWKIQYLPALQSLVIYDCPALASRYKQGVGPDWHLVSHIPRVWIFPTED